MDKTAAVCYNLKAVKFIHVPVAQLVEHLTFNQGARDSSSRRRTIKAVAYFATAFFVT